MTSSTHPPTGMNMGDRPPDRVITRQEPGGPPVFGGVLLLLLGFFNLLDGIAAVNSSRVFTANATYVVGDLRAWGWTISVLAILQVLTGIGVLVGSEAARWFGVFVLTLNALAQMFFIPSYPFWSLAIIAVDIVAIYGLVVHVGRRPAY